MSTTAHLEQYLHEHIPLSKELGVTAVEATPDAVRLAAPLEPNLNHRSTVFGGSISALAILSGWSLLWLRLRDVTGGHHIVINSNEVAYLAPARADFEAVCSGLAPADWDMFTRTFYRRGMARIELTSEVFADGVLIATFTGRFVVFRPDKLD